MQRKLPSLRDEADKKAEPASSMQLDDGDGLHAANSAERGAVTHELSMHVLLEAAANCAWCTSPAVHSPRGSHNALW